MEGHVCFLPRVGVTFQWSLCPVIFNPIRRVDDYGFLDCFSESYEEVLGHLLDPDLPSVILARVCRCMPQLAIKNPSFPLLAMVDPILGEQTVEKVSSLRRAEGIDPNGPLVEWPEKRLDINTFKFPWELDMIDFTYVCKRTGESRQGVVWDNGYVGTDSGDRYCCPKDFAKAAAKEGTIRMGWWMTRKASDTLWAILELQPIAVDGKVTSPRMKMISHRYGTYLVFVGEDDRGVAFWDPVMDEAPWIGDFDGCDYERAMEMSLDDWCCRVLIRCGELVRLPHRVIQSWTSCPPSALS